MLAGETAAEGLAEGALAGLALALCGAFTAELFGGVEVWPPGFAGAAALPVSLAPSAPVLVLTGAPTGTAGSAEGLAGASLVVEVSGLSAGALAEAVEFESGAASCPCFGSRGFSDDAEGLGSFFSSFFGAGRA